MSKFVDRLLGRDLPFKVKGVNVVPSTYVGETSTSHADNFTRNLVSVRTVTYAGAGYGSSYATMYRRQPAVRAVVDFLARNIAQLNPKVYERVSGSDRLELDDHRLARLLRNPNPATTRYVFLRDTVSDLAIYDRAYWRKLGTIARLALVRVPPSAMSVEMEAGRRVYRGPDGQEIPRRSLVVFAGYSPDGGDEGVSPLETLRRVLAEEAAATANREFMWHNSARMAGHYERPLEAPEWSDVARARFREGVESMLTGPQNAGRFGVLEEGMTWVKNDFTPPTDDYVAGRRLTYEEVSIAYGVPPVVIGMGSETKSNAETFHRQMYQDVLGPWLRFLQDEIELQLLPDLEPMGNNRVYVEFNLAEKLKGSFEEQQTALTTAVGVPHMTINEARARLNLTRVDEDWADTPVQPLNVMYGGQPAVTVPTEVPGAPGSASLAPPSVKSARKPPGAVLARRERAAKEHETLFRKHFERQQRALTSKAAPDRERWDRELTGDLYLLAVETTRKSGRLAALQLGGVYDEHRTLAYLVENSRFAAEGVNAATFDALEAALDAEETAEVFEQAKTVRSEFLGLSRATTLIAFARVEAAKHSSDADGKTRYKRWVVTSKNSRHPQMNGERVPVGEPFSNGLMCPGDGAHGSADDVAGCRCLLALE